MDMIILVVDATKGMQAQTLECVVIGEAVMARGTDVIVVLNKVRYFSSKVCFLLRFLRRLKFRSVYWFPRPVNQTTIIAAPAPRITTLTVLNPHPPRLVGRRRRRHRRR